MLLSAKFGLCKNYIMVRHSAILIVIGCLNINYVYIYLSNLTNCTINQAKTARLAQSVEHETLNLRVVGSSPTLGAYTFSFIVNLVNLYVRH